MTKNKNKNPISFFWKRKKQPNKKKNLFHKSKEKEKENMGSLSLFFFCFPSSHIVGCFFFSFFHLCHVFGVDRQIEYGLDNLPINFSIIKVRSWRDESINWRYFSQGRSSDLQWSLVKSLQGVLVFSGGWGLVGNWIVIIYKEKKKGGEKVNRKEEGKGDERDMFADRKVCLIVEKDKIHCL